MKYVMVLRYLVWVLVLSLSGAFASGENVFLHKYLEEQVGTIPHYRQSSEDCSAVAAAVGVDIVNAIRVNRGELDQFPGLAAPEPIYWGSRNEIGKDKLRNRSGSYASWVAKWLRDYGVLYRQVYTDGEHSIDFTKYDRTKPVKRKRSGVPDWLESIAKQNPIDIRKMSGVQDVIVSIKSGRPVIINSSYAFPRQRDAQGFTVPYLDQSFRGPLLGIMRKRSRKEWRHTMLATGYVDGDRRGIVIQNSSFDDLYQEGPNPYNLPFDSWAVDVKYVDLMVKDYYDAYALGTATLLDQSRGWVIILSTPGCEACERQASVMPDGYRWGKLEMTRSEMQELGLQASYPTTVVVEDGESVKTFQGFAPWTTIKPFAEKAKK